MGLGNLKVASKVMLSLALLSLIVVAAIVFSSQRMYAIDQGYARLFEGDAELARSIGEANQRLATEGRLLYRRINDNSEGGDQVTDARMRSNEKDFHDLLRRAKQLNPAYEAEFARIDGDFDALMALARAAMKLDDDKQDLAALDLVRLKFDPADR